MRISDWSSDVCSSDLLLGSMLAGGYDKNALAWAPAVSVGSHAWGVLAVGSPRALSGMSAGAVERFSDDDDSADTLRSKFLVAGLAGLGRLDANAAASAASDLSVDLGKQTRWSRDRKSTRLNSSH